MMNYDNKIREIINSLNKHDFFDCIIENFHFSDEPRVYSYSCMINDSSSYAKIKKFICDGDGCMGGAGLSFDSKSLALLRSIGETIERFCMFSQIPKDKLFRYQNNNPQHNTFPITEYINIAPDQFKDLSWVEGNDMANDNICHIPAQLITLNFKMAHNEPLLAPVITTGCAVGFDKESTLLRGIYEVIERDAIMGTYLLKPPVCKINIKQLESKRIQDKVDYFNRYLLEWQLFDITNDLEIPSFLSILIDSTGNEPTYSFGSKSGLKIEDVIIDSVEEAYMERLWIKYLMYQKTKLSVTALSQPTRAERAIIWSKKNMRQKLTFLTSKKPQKMPLTISKQNIKHELKKVITVLNIKGHRTYNVDINQSLFSKLGIYVYKTIIPSLQPLYLYEKRKENLRMKRLKTISLFFKQKKININMFPHPFI